MNEQPSLLDWQPPQPPVFHFLGSTFKSERDQKRLSKQLKTVHDVMQDGRKRTLRQLADDAGCPEASASARFRDLVRLSYPMMKENLGSGTWTYWMVVSTRGEQQ